MQPEDLISCLRQAATGDRQRKAACADDSQIAAYVDGTLGPEDFERVEAHLADCQACASLVGELSRHRRFDATEPVPELLLARARRFGKASHGGSIRFAPHLMAAAIAVVSISVLIHYLPVPESPAETRLPPVAPTTRNISSGAAPLRILSPVAGEAVDAGRLVIHWTAIPGSRYYEVHIVTDSGELVSEQRTDATEWQPDTHLHLRPGTEYFVRIDAYSPEARVVSSAHVPFSIVDPR